MHQLELAAGPKSEVYPLLIKQIQHLCEEENDLVANLANISAAIAQTFGHHWTGFYLVKGEELVLGPFQGPVACTRIGFGKGVCGTAWREKRTQVVADVEQFPGHIACSPYSRSEIVVPFVWKDEVKLVLDIDSSDLHAFDEEDRHYLETLLNTVLPAHFA